MKDERLAPRFLGIHSGECDRGTRQNPRYIKGIAEDDESRTRNPSVLENRDEATIDQVRGSTPGIIPGSNLGSAQECDGGIHLMSGGGGKYKPYTTNAIYLPEGWFTWNPTPGATFLQNNPKDKNAHKYGFQYLFCNVGSIEPDGKLKYLKNVDIATGTGLGKRIIYANQWIDYRNQYCPSAQLIAWISARMENVDIRPSHIRDSIMNECATICGGNSIGLHKDLKGFDGVHLDFEPSKYFKEHLGLYYLQLGCRIRETLDTKFPTVKKHFSIAAPPVECKSGFSESYKGSEISCLKKEGGKIVATEHDMIPWSGALIYHFSMIADAIAVMCFDSCATKDAEYQEQVKRTTVYYANHIRDPKTCALLPLQPAYKSSGTCHYAVENIVNCTKGIRAALDLGVQIGGSGVFWWWDLAPDDIPNSRLSDWEKWVNGI